MPRSEKPLSKKKKFIKDGVFYAELNDLLGRELAEHGYAGCEIRVTPARTEVIIRATNTQSVVGKDGRTIRELTALIQKRFKFAPGAVMLFAEKVRNKGLSALAQAEAVKYRLTEGLSVRRACYSVLRFVMDSGAKGCEVTISGKLRGQRAKSMKFREGYMIHAGDPVRWYIDTAVKHILLRQGVLGVKVKIMLPFDPTGQLGGPQKDLPDVVKIHEPKEVEPQGSSGYSGGGGGGRGDAYNAGQIDQSQADYHQYAPDQQQAQQQQPQQPQQPQQSTQSTQSTQPAQPAQQQSQQPQQAQQSSNYQQQSGSGQQDYDQSQQFGYEDTGYEQYGQFGGAQQGQYGQGYTEEQDQQYGYDVNYDQRQGGQQQSGQGFQQGYGRGYQQF